MINNPLFVLSVFLLGVTILSASPIFAQPYIENIENLQEKEHLTKPTFGKSHETGGLIVKDGFIFNNQSFSIVNNFHAPYPEQSIHLGEVNSFEAKVFSPKGLKVQEFLFGIPEVNDGHLSELGVEVWYSSDGEIENVKVIQNSKIIDEDSIVAIHEKNKCTSHDLEKKCDSTKISVKFLEPLKDKVMALKAIDYENRYQITYLNEGFDISEPSMNPMRTMLIPPTTKGEPLQVTQMGKYSAYWISEDGKIFERNDFGSFKQKNISFVRFQDSGDPLTRHHSGFVGIMEYEKERALKIFNATSVLSQLSESYSIDMPIGERITEETKEKMNEQEIIAEKILEESQVQTRYSKHSKVKE